jgi:antitoxin component of MazEF toxin-antitoxin module
MENLMSIPTYKGTVENGQIKLEINVKLPEKTEVYVIVPEKKPKFDLAKMAVEMPEDYASGEEDFGKPVGKEVW